MMASNVNNEIHFRFSDILLFLFLGLRGAPSHPKHLWRVGGGSVPTGFGGGFRVWVPGSGMDFRSEPGLRSRTE